MNHELFYHPPSMLFTGLGDIGQHLRDNRAGVEAEVRNWNEDELLKASDADIVDYIVAKYSLECPTLNLDGRQLLPTADVTMAGGPMFAGRPFGPVRVKRSILLVPFTGRREVFRLTPSIVDTQPPLANVDDQFVGLVVDGGASGPAIRAEFDRQIETIERYLGWLRAEIDPYQSQLEGTVRNAIASRRQEILDLRAQEASIGFPVVRTPEAATFTFPVTRKEIVRPVPRESGVFVPEPEFVLADYEAALQLIRNARNGFERSPSVTGKLDEEEIRDLLLIILNGHFQGAAGGELFNGRGKTDVLIRAGDRNIFIGECKFWHGPAMIGPTLDQLLSYMVWRDTKGALLLFIRNKDFSATVSKAVEALKAHPNFKQTLAEQDGERYDFLVRSASDPDRDIRLALIPFHIQ